MSMKAQDSQEAPVRQNAHKSRAEYENILKQLRDGAARATNANQHRSLVRQFKSVSLEEEGVPKKLEQYATAVFTHNNELLLEGNAETYGSFMPTVAKEDFPSFLSKLLVTQCLYLHPMKSKTRPRNKFWKNFPRKSPRNTN